MSAWKPYLGQSLSSIDTEGDRREGYRMVFNYGVKIRMSGRNLLLITFLLQSVSMHLSSAVECVCLVNVYFRTQPKCLAVVLPVTTHLQSWTFLNFTTPPPAMVGKASVTPQTDNVLNLAAFSEHGSEYLYRFEFSVQTSNLALQKYFVLLQLALQYKIK